MLLGRFINRQSRYSIYHQETSIKKVQCKVGPEVMNPEETAKREEWIFSQQK